MKTFTPAPPFCQHILGFGFKSLLPELVQWQYSCLPPENVGLNTWFLNPNVGLCQEMTSFPT